MKPTEIRAELLAQHNAIREQVDAVRRALQGGGRDALRSALAKLGDLVRGHNRREEELLRGILPTVDAWGPARTEIMLEEHVKEHGALYDAVMKASASDDASGFVPGLLTGLLDHMAHEEKIFLSEEVLSDDAIVRDYFGG
jgi:hypothetical protein